MRSGGGPSASDLRADQSPTQVTLRNLVRVLTVAKTAASGLWQLLGFTDPWGNKETIDDAPVFSNIGFASRPRAGKGEAVTSDGVIVATRDAEIIPTDIAEDETIVANSSAVIRLKPNGDITIACKAGGTITINDGAGGAALATKADLDNLKTAIGGAAVLAGDGGATLKTNIINALVAWPTGTTVVKGK